MRVLVTGSAGFVGSHFVDHVLANTDWEIVGLDSFRHRGDSMRVQLNPRYTIQTCDISAPISHRLADRLGQFDFIANYASDSHVDRSISDPVPFVNNNVNMALNMLEFARGQKKLKAFVQISTDEVFGSSHGGYAYKEWDRLLASNPYAASKAAQEVLCTAWWRTFQVPVIITNTMNLYGSHQDPEKFIPMCIKKIAAGEEVTIHGAPGRIGARFYIHARNQADGILWLMQNHTPQVYIDGEEEVLPSRFNVVGEAEVDNLSLAQMIADIIGKPLKYRLVDFHAARPGHDRFYRLDGTKLAQAGWKQPRTFEESLRATVEWTLKNPSWML